MIEKESQHAYCAIRCCAYLAVGVRRGTCLTFLRGVISKEASWTARRASAVRKISRDARQAVLLVATSKAWVEAGRADAYILNEQWKICGNTGTTNLTDGVAITVA